MSAPDVSVVIASHDRTDRLPTLLDSLAEQTLPPERWEVVVVHTYAPEVAGALLDDRELARAGRLRHERVDPAAA